MSDKFTKKTLNGMRICVFYIFLFLILVIIDQFVKMYVVNSVELNQQVTVIKDFFSIHHTRNTGSAFSLFADKSWGIYFLSGISTVMGVVIFILMLIASHREMKLLGLAFCLLSSGAVGNLIDRFRLKYVVDFLRFDFGSYTFPIFNFADMCAVVGTILFICIVIFASKYFEIFWNVIFHKKSSKKEASVDDVEEELVQITEDEELENTDSADRDKERDEDRDEDNDGESEDNAD